MATIETAVDLFQDVANAFVQLPFFIYGSNTDIANYRDKKYPVLLIENNPRLLDFNIRQNQTTYLFTFNFYTLYQRDSETEHDAQRYQGEVEQLAWQYFKELTTKAKPLSDIRIADPINEGGYLLHAPPDKTIRYSVKAKITIYGACDLGTFNYD